MNISNDNPPNTTAANANTIPNIMNTRLSNSTTSTAATTSNTTVTNKNCRHRCCPAQPAADNVSHFPCCDDTA